MISSVEACYCSVCHPTGAREQCSACGEEIRHGVREGKTGFWHRENVDHSPTHGHRITRAQAEADERHRREHVYYDDDGKPYTAAEWEISRDKDTERRKRRMAEYLGKDPDYVPPLPEPEVRRTPVGPKDERVPGGTRTITNLLAKQGWELTRLTYARGPYMSTGGKMLSISDTIVLNAMGPEVDGGTAIAVASWRDGKFDTAYAGRLKDGVAKVDPVNATDLKAWIKEPA